MKTKNPFEYTAAHWVRYSDYEWRGAEDGHEYVMPKPDAKPAVYDPISIADDLTVDAINIGLLIFHKAPDDEIRSAMLTFARSYGLLCFLEIAIPTSLPPLPNSRPIVIILLSAIYISISVLLAHKTTSII